MHTDDKEQHPLCKLEHQLSSILHRRHRVLILLPPEDADLIRMMEQAVDRCGCIPVVPTEDQRWKTLLQLAFVERTETVIGTAQLTLGLLKVARATNTPLFIHDVLLCSGSRPWLRNELSRSLDCRVWDLKETLQRDFVTHKHTNETHNKLEDHLLIFPGILDFQVQATECGTSLEVILLDGQKVSGHPSCAKLTQRNWNPETDVPFSLKISEKG